MQGVRKVSLPEYLMPLEPMPEGGGRALGSRLQAFRLACLAIITCLSPPVAQRTASAAPSGAVDERTEAGGMAARYVDDLAAAWQLEARQAFRKAEIERLAGAAGLSNRSVTQSFASFDAETRRAMTALLEENNQPALAALEAAAEESSDRRRKIIDRCAASAPPNTRAGWNCSRSGPTSSLPGNSPRCSASTIAGSGFAG